MAGEEIMAGEAHCSWLLHSGMVSDGNYVLNSAMLRILPRPTFPNSLADYKLYMQLFCMWLLRCVWKAVAWASPLLCVHSWGTDQQRSTWQQQPMPFCKVLCGSVKAE